MLIIQKTKKLSELEFVRFKDDRMIDTTGKILQSFNPKNLNSDNKNLNSDDKNEHEPDSIESMEFL
jgi:hypothetical protein